MGYLPLHLSDDGRKCLCAHCVGRETEAQRRYFLRASEVVQSTPTTATTPWGCVVPVPHTGSPWGLPLSPDASHCRRHVPTPAPSTHGTEPGRCGDSAAVGHVEGVRVSVVSGLGKAPGKSSPPRPPAVCAGKPRASQEAVGLAESVLSWVRARVPWGLRLGVQRPWGLAVCPIYHVGLIKNQ